MIRGKIPPLFHPLLGTWFTERLGAPTDIQSRAWPKIASGSHVLVTAPAYPDFPILLETWRTCLQDEFDLDNLKRLLEEVRSGRIKLTEATTTAASPFASGLVWKQTNTCMYEDDRPFAGIPFEPGAHQGSAFFPPAPAAPAPVSCCLAVTGCPGRRRR